MRLLSRIAVAPMVIASALASGTVLADSNQSAGEYAKAKAKLSTDYYTLYRIVEKLSRANGLVGTPWLANVRSDYELNSFADKINLIAVPKPALESLSSDVDAMACMVGREMAHHVRKHQAIGPLELAGLKQQIEQEAIEQSQKNESSKHGWGMGLGLAGGILGINTSGIQGNINSNTDRATAKMVKDKEAELARRMAETSSRIEKEADEDAFIYLTRAGRDPKGCIRYLEIISRNPRTEADTANPQIPGRIQAYRDFINRESPAKFKKEGSSFLAKYTKPLTFSMNTSTSILTIRLPGSQSKSIDKF